MLLVFEGNFGLGKTTLIKKVCDWIIEFQGNPVITEWNSVDEIKNTYLRLERIEKIYNPYLYIFFQLLDMVYRYENEILPALKQGRTVVCDRYYYTLIVRALVRGVNIEPLLELVRIFQCPDYLFYLDGGAELSYLRVMPRGEMRTEVWAVGMDIKEDRRKVDLDKYRQHLEKNLMFYRQLMCNENVTWVSAKQDATDAFDKVVKKIIEGCNDGR